MAHGVHHGRDKYAQQEQRGWVMHTRACKDVTLGVGSFDNCSRTIRRSSSSSWSSLEELSEWGSQRRILPSIPFTAMFTAVAYITVTKKALTYTTQPTVSEHQKQYDKNNDWHDMSPASTAHLRGV